MKTHEEWLNSVGEAVSMDMLVSDPGKPGSRTEEIVKAIQNDAYASAWRKGMSDAANCVLGWPGAAVQIRKSRDGRSDQQILNNRSGEGENETQAAGH
jgi:hypothetical protein